MDLYEILGLSRTADDEQIKAAYRLACKRYHPDAASGSTELFRKSQEAYETLSDPAKRSNYDATLTAQDRSSSAAQQRSEPAAPVHERPLPTTPAFTSLWVQMTAVEKRQFHNYRFNVDLLGITIHCDYTEEISLAGGAQTMWLHDAANGLGVSSDTKQALKLDGSMQLDELLDELNYQYATAHGITVEEVIDRQVKAARKKARAWNRSRAADRTAPRPAIRTISLIATVMSVLTGVSALLHTWVIERLSRGSESAVEGWNTLGGWLPFDSSSVVFKIGVTVATAATAAYLVVLAYIRKAQLSKKGLIVNGVLVAAVSAAALPVILPSLALAAMWAIILGVVAVIASALFR